MSILFTEAVMRAASEILERHHRAVAAAIYGKDALSSEDWDLAVNLGLVDPKAPPTTLNGQIYQMGMMLAHMDQAERQSRYGTTAEEWLTEVERNPVPMTVTEDRAASYARRRAAQFVKGLGTRATSSVTTTLLTEDARLSSEFRSAIRDAVGARFGDDAAAARLKDRGIKEGLADDFFDDAFRGTMGRLRSDIGPGWSGIRPKKRRPRHAARWSTGYRLRRHVHPAATCIRAAARRAYSRCPSFRATARTTRSSAPTGSRLSEPPTRTACATSSAFRRT